MTDESGAAQTCAFNSLKADSLLMIDKAFLGNLCALFSPGGSCKCYHLCSTFGVPAEGSSGQRSYAFQ